MARDLKTATVTKLIISHFPEAAEAILQQNATTCPKKDLRRGQELQARAQTPDPKAPLGTLIGWMISYIRASRQNPKTMALTHAPIGKIIHAIATQIPTTKCSSCGRKIPRHLRLIGWPLNGSCPNCAAGRLEYCYCDSPLPPSIYFSRCPACSKKDPTQLNSFSRAISITMHTINEHIHNQSDPLFAAALLEAEACALRAAWHHYHNRSEATAEYLHKLENISWMLTTRFSFKRNLHQEWHSRIIGTQTCKEEA